MTRKVTGIVTSDNQKKKAVIALNIMPFQAAEAKERQRASGVDYGRGGIKVTPVSAEPLSEEETLPPVSAEVLSEEEPPFSQPSTSIMSPEAQEKRAKEVPPVSAEPLNEKKPLSTTSDIVADVMGISSWTVKRINRIATLAPERIADIRDGKKTIHAVLNDLTNEGIIKPKIKEKIINSNLCR